MSLRILIAHALPGQRGTAAALYIGSSGAELETVKASAGPGVGSFSIINNPPAIRKSNPGFDPASKLTAVATSGAAPSPEIPADIQKLKKPELITALTDAVTRIYQLEKELAGIHEAQLKAGEALAASAAQLLEEADSDSDEKETADSSGS